MPESYSTTINRLRSHPRFKVVVSLLISLLLPPLGLIFGLWLLMKGRKVGQGQLSKWGLAAIVLAAIGIAGYAYSYSYYEHNIRKDNKLLPSEYPQSNLFACLDDRQSVLITKSKPLLIELGDNAPTAKISLTLAYHFINTTNGEFEVGPPPSQKHRLTVGECK